MLLDKFQLILTTVTITPTPTPTPDQDNGWFGKFVERGKVEVPEDAGLAGGWLVDELKKAFSWLGNTVLDYIGPFVNWGSRIIIISCFIIYFCSGDRKYMSAALKWGIIFLLYTVIRSAVG